MHGVALRSPMLILLPRYLLLACEVRSLHRCPLSVQAPRAARCLLSIQDPRAARCCWVEGFFLGSWRSLSHCLSLVTPSQTRAVGLVRLLWPPPLRLRHQIQMTYPQVLLGGRRAVSGGPPGVSAV